MNTNEQGQIAIVPVISYPREAHAGRSYLMTIDLRLSTKTEDWPYEDEEYSVSFMLNTMPLFSYEPVGDHDPSVVLHRFGGTYGPAMFLLTAAQQEMEGTIHVMLLNDWGIQIEQIALESKIGAGGTSEPEILSSIDLKRDNARASSSASVDTPPQKAREELPPSIDLRPECPPAYNGGQLSGVVANALAAALEFCLMKQHQFPIFTPSRLFMYYNERAIEGTVSSDSGSTIKDGIKSVETQGVCPEDMWPYDIAKFAERPPDACYQAALQYRIFLFKGIRRDLDEMKKCLASGYPFIFGFTVYDSFESQEVAQSGHAPMPQPEERVMGGHAALAVGYDDANQWFIVLNHWGTGWGMQGYFTLPYAYLLDSDLSSDFWTVSIKQETDAVQRQRPKFGITCLVTLHGIGFEQPPQPQLNTPGYADLLHEHLSKYLGTMLSDDPNRERKQPGQSGAIYVQSRWLTAAGTASREEGLKRLGSWSQDTQHIETNQAPLVANDATVSHIALVYSELRPASPSSSNYTSAKKLIHKVHTENLERVGYPPPAKTADQKERLAPSLWSRIRTAVSRLSPESSTILTSLEDDIASYVSNNEERERVRSFVAEVLLRLASRDDVGEIVLNTHSNGTVIALDVIRQLPPFAAAKIRVFITAGSPLRKYVDLFHWGQQIESVNPIPRWYNFWDEYDPVADPLEPPITWHRGDSLLSPYDPKLFILVDPNSGMASNIEVTDIKVDNVYYSRGGGLQAHNYWDNEEQFVKYLASIVRALAEMDLS